MAVSRLWLAALLQMTLPGVPCVYYGDEAGLEGYSDPYDRASYPWGHEDEDCRAIYRNAIAVRKTLPVLTTGDFEPFGLGDDVFGFWRRDADMQVCVLVNASLHESRTVRVPAPLEVVDDVVSGRTPKVEGGEAEVFLWPLGSSVLCFQRQRRLQAPMPRGMGACRRRWRWKQSTELPRGQRKTSASPPSTLGVRPLTTSSTTSSGAGTRTVRDSCRLAFTSTHTCMSASRLQKPKTSSPRPNGSKSPVVRTGSVLRTAMALR